MTTNDFNLLKSFFSDFPSWQIALEIDNAHSFTVTILDDFLDISSDLLERIFFKRRYLKINGIRFCVTTNPMNGKLQIIFSDY